MAATDPARQGANRRTLVLWCPDWPAVAAARQAGVPSSEPVAVFRANRVMVCTAAARHEGVRIGMRRREAQSRCPGLVVFALTGDLGGDLPGVAGRMFEPVATAVEQLVPGIEILRPGLVAVAARGPRRYFGDEQRAAEKIVDVVEALDVEARIGIADELEVAVLAARQQRIVPVGGDSAFCATLPISELAREEVLAPATRADLVGLLQRLGIRTAGDLAALPAERVATRFGRDGVATHRLASGQGDRGVSRRLLPTDLTLEQECDPPLHRVDTAAFLARALAERFHAGLAAAGLACSRLTITAHFTHGPPAHRTWRAARPLTAAATADRLRWQLDGWLTARAVRAARPPKPGAATPPADQEAVLWDGDGVSGITALVLEPVEAIDAGRIQYGLWGSDGDDDHRAGWAFARIQGLLGPQSVLTPVLSGGRTARDRVTMISWGDERVPARDPDAPWPGALPAPSPVVLDIVPSGAGRPGARLPVTLTDAGDAPVVLTGRGRLTAEPAAVGEREIVAWAGPWLFDERWWEAVVPAELLVATPASCAARIQVLCADGSALLLGFVPAGGPARGAARWVLEGVYD